MQCNVRLRPFFMERNWGVRAKEQKRAGPLLLNTHACINPRRSELGEVGWLDADAAGGGRPIMETPGTPGLLYGANSSLEDRLQGVKAERAFAIAVAPRTSWCGRIIQD